MNTKAAFTTSVFVINNHALKWRQLFNDCFSLLTNNTVERQYATHSPTLVNANAIVLVLINNNVYDVAVVPEQPTNLQGEALSPNSIQLTWDAPEATEANLESYELYFNDSHFRQNIRVTINPPQHSYLLEDLTPDTIYHIRVAAKSSRGEGASTPTIQVRTMDYGRHISN